MNWTGLGSRGTGARLALTACLATIVVAPLAPASAYPRPGQTARVSVSSSGQQATQDSDQFNRVAMTPDGRYVAFASAATNLVGGDTDNGLDVFVHDQRTGTTKIASVSSAGAFGLKAPTDVGCQGAWDPSISADGRYVAFTSCYLGLAPTDVHDVLAAAEVYVHDMRTGATTRVSVDSKGTVGSGAEPSISADGRYVAFSSASPLDSTPCPTDPEGQLLCSTPVGGILGLGTTSVYLRDLHTKKTVLVSVSTAGARADAQSNAPVISANGRWVAFTSFADNLVSTHKNYACTMTSFTTTFCQDVYLRDLTQHRTELVSVALTGVAAGGSTTAYDSSAVSRDGRYVAFASTALRLVPNDEGALNAIDGAYVRDRSAGRTRRITVSSSGGPVSLGQTSVAISADGRFVAAYNIIDVRNGCPANSDAGAGIGVYDAITGAWEMVDRTDANGHPSGCAHALSGHPQLSADGRYVAFTSNGSYFVHGDTNGKYDVFVRDRGAAISVDGLAGSGRLTVAGEPSFASTGVVAVANPFAALTASPTIGAAGLTSASLAYRPAYGDLFGRLDVARMPPYDVASPAIVYGLNLNVNGIRYQVRVAKTGLGASYGLFRFVSGGWTQVTALDGGYGTTGEEVVFALPLRAIEAQRGGRLSAVIAFAGVGSYAAGASTMTDQIALSR